MDINNGDNHLSSFDQKRIRQPPRRQKENVGDSVGGGSDQQLHAESKCEVAQAIRSYVVELGLAVYEWRIHVASVRQRLRNNAGDLTERGRVRCY